MTRIKKALNLYVLQDNKATASGGCTRRPLLPEILYFISFKRYCRHKICSGININISYQSWWMVYSILCNKTMLRRKFESVCLQLYHRKDVHKYEDECGSNISGKANVHSIANNMPCGLISYIQ